MTTLPPSPKTESIARLRERGKAESPTLTESFTATPRHARESRNSILKPGTTPKNYDAKKKNTQKKIKKTRRSRRDTYNESPIFPKIMCVGARFTRSERYKYPLVKPCGSRKEACGKGKLIFASCGRDIVEAKARKVEEKKQRMNGA